MKVEELTVIQTVTVLIATYNHEKYIIEALNSVVDNARDLVEHGYSQLKIEVVIVDDGSIDETKDVIQEFNEQQKTLIDINYMYQDNQGQPAAYENAVPHIKGDLVYLLDSDDRFLPEKMRKVLEAFQQHPDVGLVAHPLYVVDSVGVPTGEIRPKAAKISHGDMREIMKKYGRNVAPATSGLAFRADLFREIHPTPLRGIPSAADSYLTFAATLLRPVYSLSEPLGEYRQHTAGMYIKRMTSIPGLERTYEIQKRIVSRYGLEETLKRNSYFMRNIYALNRMKYPFTKWVKDLYNLNVATFTDPFLPPRKKIVLLLFWDGSAFMPRPIFWRFWLFFQKMQTGMKKIEGAEEKR